MGAIGQVARRVRLSSLGTAFRADPRRDDVPSPKGRSDLVWSVRNVSVTGAFLETNGPVSIGTEIDLTLVFGAAMIHVTVEVVRVQEPRWGTPGGVGVTFKRYGSGAKEFLEAYIAAAEEGEHT